VSTCAPRARVDGVEHDQPGVVDPAVPVREAALQARLQRRAGRVAAQVQRLRARQQRAPGQVVVEQQAGADQPRRAHRGLVRQHEAQRPGDVRRRAQQHLALGQRLAHQRELVMLEVAQAAVQQLGRRRRGVRGEVVALDQHHAPAAPGEVARDAAAVDAAADDEDVAVGGGGVGGHGVRHGGPGAAAAAMLLRVPTPRRGVYR